MKKGYSTLLFGLLLILLLLNFNYSSLKDFAFTRKEYLDIAIIMLCLVVLISGQIRKSKRS